MAVSFIPRLVAYRSGTDKRLGFLTEPISWDVSFTESAQGALKLSYSMLAQGGQILARPLAEGLDIAIELPTEAGWVEPPQGRFRTLDGTENFDNQQQVIEIEAPSYVSVLAQAQIMDWGGGIQGDSRYYDRVTPGGLIADLVQVAQKRGFLAMISLDFDAQKDSTGTPWASVLEAWKVDVGAGIDTALQGLVEAGLIEWQFQGRRLSMWAIDTKARRKDSGQGMVWLHLGEDVSQAQRRQSLQNLVTHANVRDGNGKTYIIENPGAPRPWGPVEKFFKLDGVGNEGVARAMVQAELEKAAAPAEQDTKNLILPGRYRPMIDYQSGDWVKCETRPGVHESVRLRQVTLAYSAEGLQGSIILNDRFLEKQLADARLMKRITGGAKITGSGTGANLSGIPAPGQPVAMTVSSQAFVDEYGRARASVTLKWNLEIESGGDRHYVVEGRCISEAGEDAPWQPMGIYAAPVAEIPSLPAGSIWEFRVAGYTGVRSSEWCFSERVELARKQGAGSLLPVAPGLSSEKGIVYVHFAGKVVSPLGVPLGVPADFARAEAALTLGPTPPVEDAVVASVSSAPAKIAIPAALGSRVFGWIRLVDTSGNRTQWVGADPESITVRGITGPDIEAGSVTSNQIDTGSITSAIANLLQVNAGKVDGIEAEFVKAFIQNLTGNSAALNTLWSDIIRGRYISADIIDVNIARIQELYYGDYKIDPRALQGMGTVKNPVSYGSTALDGYSIEAGRGEIGTGSTAIELNNWGHVNAPRINSDNVVIPKNGQFAWALDSSGHTNLTKSGVYLGYASVEDGIYCSAPLIVQGIIRASGNVTAPNISETSTESEKVGIEPLRDASALLDLEPVAYRSKEAFKQWREQMWSRTEPSEPLPPRPVKQAGLLAEEVEAAGLGIYVVKDDKGQPVALNYTRMVAGLIPIIRAQRDRISDLEGRLESMEARLASLEGRAA